MSKRVHFVMPDDLIARIDAALPDGVSRGEFVRRAVERTLRDIERRSLGTLSESGDTVALTATFTRDQMDDLAARRVSEISPVRSTAQVKRDVQPRPKGGKR